MSELLGADLDAAVARALNIKGLVYRPNGQPAYEFEWDPEGRAHERDIHEWKMWRYYMPSLDGELAIALQTEHRVAVFPVTRFDNTFTEWVAGFDIDYHTEDRDVVVEHEARGATPAIAICRALVARHEAAAQRDRDKQVAVAQAAIAQAAQDHLEMLKGQAWERATEARRSRVPFTAFANDEEREAYRWAMDAQLDVIQHRNPETYPPASIPLLRVATADVVDAKPMLPPCPCHGPICMTYTEKDGVQCMKGRTS